MTGSNKPALPGCKLHDCTDYCSFYDSCHTCMTERKMQHKVAGTPPTKFVRTMYVAFDFHDMYEMTKHYRPGYQVKPELPMGSVFPVVKEWENFYGAFYRVSTPNGEYDLPIDICFDMQYER